MVAKISVATLEERKVRGMYKGLNFRTLRRACGNNVLIKWSFKGVGPDHFWILQSNARLNIRRKPCLSPANISGQTDVMFVRYE